MRELVHIHGGTRDEEFKVRPEASDVLHQTKQNICMQCPLVSLVHYHHTEKVHRGIITAGLINATHAGLKLAQKGNFFEIFFMMVHYI